MRSVPVDDPGPLLALLPRRDLITWTRGSDGFAAWGVAARFSSSGAERFSAASEWWNRTVAAADIYTQRGFFNAIFNDALTDTTPLFDLISKYIDQAMMDAIAEEYAEGRLLLIASTNLDVQRPSIWNIMAVIGLTTWEGTARFVRAEILALREQEFVQAAAALGASGPRTIGRHLLPNVLPPLLVYTSTLAGMMIVASAGLSFLGLGVQPPTPDWGVMVGNGRLVLYRAAHVATIPGIVIVVVALAFNFVGDGLREALDPRARR